MTTRDRSVLLVLGVAAITAAFWFLLLSPRRDEARALDAKIEAAQAQVEAGRQMVATATAAKEAYAGDYAAVAKLGKAVPVDDDVPSLVFQLEDAADRSKVDFRSIKLASGGAPAPAAAPPAAQVAGVAAESKGAEAAKATPPAPGSAPAASGGTPPAPASAPASGAAPPAASGAGAAVPATQAAAAALPPGATVGAAGLTTMPFDFSFEGGYFSLQDFLGRLDRFTNVRGEDISVRGRLLTVDGFSLSSRDPSFSKMVASVRATAYLLPGEEGLTAGATPAGPAPASTPVPAAGTAGSTPTPAASATGG